MADLIDKEQALGCFWNYGYTDGTGYDETEMPAYYRLQALPVVAEVEDCISRQAAIDAVDRAVTKEAARWSIQALPSAQPERKGRWIGGEYGHCSECGHEGCASDIWNDCGKLYCPNCGAKMEVDGC